MLEKNWQICRLLPVPKECMLVFHGKFKCLMQSGFFSNLPWHGVIHQNGSMPEANYQLLNFYYVLHRYTQRTLSFSTPNHFRCLTLEYVNASCFWKFVFACLLANESIQDTQINNFDINGHCCIVAPSQFPIIILFHCLVI